MSKLCALFSSSKANCTLVSSSFGNILVDFGASLKAVSLNLADIGLEVSDIDAVFVTHEHSDHVKGLKAFTSKFQIPVLSSAKTLQALINANAVDKNAVLKEIDNNIIINDICVNRFSVSHDCVDPAGYRIELPDGESACVCTDLGVVTENVKNAIKGTTALLIESNHDLKMLQNGPYPPELKLRIASEKGHISNNVCAALLKELIDCSTNRFMLGHLSENNNTVLLARAAAEAALMDKGAKMGEDYILNVASPCTKETLYF